ncbi:MAG: protein kinase [Planctomycetes bacterium]|nr:protein kinase [Planctomycetota bacterium]
MTPPTSCLELAQLQRLLEGTLSPQEERCVASHLDECARCREALDRVAGLPPPRAWQGAAAEAPLGEALERAMSALKADTRILARRPAPAPEEENLLTLLCPNEPGRLGRFGHYQVTEVLGRGGFGVVLKAFDPALHRFVAIKVLAPQLATSAAARKRFAREGRAAAAVSHEHVVAIYGVDEADGLPYLVMEYVAGISLQERIERTGLLELADVLRIGRQAAAGLAAAHAQGLVHRDVKPANILLESGLERVKLTDFGLARAADDASLTQSGVLAGTPQYMAPEQARGEPVDHRADLFSLGSVLYAMCAGRPPFRASATLAVLRRVCEDLPRPLTEINPEVPVWLEDVIATLHAKDPAERFQSAAEVAEVLERGLAHLRQPQRVPPPSSPRRKAPRRWPGSLAVMLLLAGLGLLGLARWIGTRKHETPGRRNKTETSWETRSPTAVPVRPRRGLNFLRSGPVLTAAFSPGSEVLALACDDGMVRLWNLSTNRLRGALGEEAQPGARRVWSVAFSPDGKTLASAAGDWHRHCEPGEVKLWDVPTGKLLPSPRGHSALAFTVAFSPDGRVLASGGWDNVVRLWDPVQGKELAVLRGHKDAVRSVAFSPDGRTLASGSFDGTVRLWDVALREPRLVLQAKPYEVNCVVFSPDGRMLATAENLPSKDRDSAGGRDWDTAQGHVRLWDRDGTERAVLRGPRGMVLSVAFAPDGRTLVSGGGRWDRFGEVTLWDVSGKERLTLHSHARWVESVAFSPDGHTLVSAGGTPNAPAEVQLWDVGPSAAEVPPRPASPPVAGSRLRQNAAPRDGRNIAETRSEALLSVPPARK